MPGMWGKKIKNKKIPVIKYFLALHAIMFQKLKLFPCADRTFLIELVWIYQLDLSLQIYVALTNPTTKKIIWSLPNLKEIIFWKYLIDLFYCLARIIWIIIRTMQSSPSEINLKTNLRVCRSIRLYRTMNSW